MIIQYLSLEEWDAQVYRKPHTIRTLRAWAKSGLIQPKPQKHGREYMVRADAIYVASMKSACTDPVIEALLHG